MPLYEYQCETCGSDFELLLRGAERAACPTCGGGKLEKRFSVPAAHVAGGASLPVCEAPVRGPCGAPACGPTGCGM